MTSHKITSLSFVFMLVISTVAFAFLIGSETKMVSALTKEEIESAKVGQSFNLEGKTYTKTDNGWSYDGSTYGSISNWFDYNNENIKGIVLTSPASGNVAGTATATQAINPSSMVRGGVADASTGYKVTVNGIEYTKLNDGDKWSYSNGGIATTTQIIEWQENVKATDSSANPVAAPRPASVAPTLGARLNILIIGGAFSTKLGNLQKDGWTRQSDGSWKNTDGTIQKADSEFIKNALGVNENAVFKDGKYVQMDDKGKIIATWDAETGTQTDAQVTHMFGTTGSWYGGAYILQGLQWAGIVYGTIGMVGGLFASDNPEQIKAVQQAAFAGVMSASLTRAIIAKGGALSNLAPGKTANWLNANQGWISAGVGAAIAWITYNSQYEKTKERTEIVTFSCLPWQAPHGGKDCELCNDGLLPCSEYRCKALGQSCSIINKGTSFERCVNTNPRDVSPPVIKPWDEKLTEGYTYFDVRDMPPGAGFKIKSTASTSGCIEPFTPITFGITTDEPAQCKIDVEPKGNYSKMTAYIGGDNLYSYNHTETLSLPSVENIKNSSLNLQNGKELSFFMRCRDANGNTNEADYELKVCVDPSPDTTAPVILGTSIQTGGCVAAESENSTVDFYLNEPAECRWGFTDSSFDQMKNNMSCSSYATQMNALTVFTCNALLTGIARDGTNFFVRCKDKPTGVNESKRNANQESYPFALRGSGQLKLKVIKPNETIYGVLNPTAVELYAETLFGCDDNKAICYYSTSDSESGYTQFFDTNNEDGVSTQRLDLTSGTYTYFVKCVDAGGNLAKDSTTFRVNIDSNAPIIARAYEEDNQLKIVTPINSRCVYTNENCDYLFQEGTVMQFDDSTVHVTEWSPIKKYYIKCIDEFRSEPADCSLIVGPTDNFL